MSNEIKGGDTQAALSNDINIITAEVNAYQRVAGEAIFEIGGRLKKSDNIDGRRKDPSYINSILANGYKEQVAIICKQIMADS